MADARLWRSRLALRWLIGGEWRWHPARFIATAVAIAIGVALGFAVHLVNGSALTSFNHAVAGVNGTADLQVTARTPLGFNEQLYPAVARADDVADASPVVTLSAKAGRGGFTLLGLDLIRAISVTPSLVGASVAGLDDRADTLFAEERLVLSSAALRATGATIGKRILVTANGHSAELLVAGSLPGVPADQAIGTVDIATAQWRFGRLGKLDRIDLKVADGDTAENAVQRFLPADATLTTPETQSRQSDAPSRAYRMNLDMLALVALLIGGLLVFSAQTLSVARRLRAFALVRTLGLPTAGIVGAVALEGLVNRYPRRLAWSRGGLWCGGVGAAAVRWRPRRRLFRRVVHPSRLPVAIGARLFLLELLAALLGSVLPARAAASVAPAAAPQYGRRN